MKNLLLFTLVFVNKILIACGFYPYGEETRISLFKPENFGYSTFSNFYYTSNSFSNSSSISPSELVLANNMLWFDYCKGKVDIPSIDNAVYKIKAYEIENNSKNAMILYLYQQNDSDALNYLRFAKRCEDFNSWQDDPWEREEIKVKPIRNELMNKAIENSLNVHNEELKKRYTFLAIRLAWYNQYFYKVNSLFKTVFENTANKDILYYWSLYFRSSIHKNKAFQNFELAQVFSNAIDKRFACHQHFNTNVPISKTLEYSITDIEKANVYLLYAIEKPDKALMYIKKMYKHNPSSEGLSFLLLREVNKIEDYVLTPYYTLFQPTTSYDYWNNKSETSVTSTFNRSEQDRLYAKELLTFVNSVDMRKVENPIFCNCCKVYLQFISRDYASSILGINQIERSIPFDTLRNQIQIIKALVLTANQDKANAKILEEVQPIIRANELNSQFIFALGKELEYLGNTTDAALLYASVNNEYNDYSFVYWKSIKNKTYSYTDYFINYFQYIDAVYTPAQVQSLIEDIKNNKNNTNSFSQFKYKKVKNEISRFYDLLGTKYIRQNELENALKSYINIDKLYWSRTYTPWGNSFNYFDKNPFYCLKYTSDFIVPKDTILLNKYTITKQLISYLHKVEDINEKDKDYYYFLIANAYYNMGSAGNIYMMRRINGWSRYDHSIIEDEQEFRQSNLAKKYYLLAKQHAKTDKFKALCLRMVIRCEKNRLQYNTSEWNYFDNYESDSLYVNNHYIKELKTNYPDYYDDLISNCDQFHSYFEARR